MVAAVVKIVVYGRGAFWVFSGCRVSAKFIKNCGRGEGLETTTCFKTVDWGKQGHAP